MIYYAVFDSPLGQMFIASTEKGVCRIELNSENAGDFFTYIGSMGRYVESVDKNSKYISQLELYFSGALKKFDMDMDIYGTDYQKKVWKELIKIPYGEVRTYGDISRTIGSCPRAVGQANRKNPLPIVIPCHRVVSSSGIGGYGGEVEGRGIDVKRYLLELEGYDCSVFNR